MLAQPRGTEAGLSPTESAEIYLELARAGRREDFRWFALSQGVGLERVDKLWQETREIVGAGGTRTGG
jgi:hypothetical protein